MTKLKYYSFAFVLALSLLASNFLLVSKLVSAASYDNTNPYSTGCAYNRPLTYQTTYIYSYGKAIGYVQLKGSAGCHTAWAYVKLYSPAPANNYVNAYVERYSTGLTLSCSSAGGNKPVNYGQTSCYSSQIYDRDPYKARAKAYFVQSKHTAITNWY